MSPYLRKKIPFSLKPSHLFFESLGTRVFWQSYNLFFKASDIPIHIVEYGAVWQYYEGKRLFNERDEVVFFW